MSKWDGTEQSDEYKKWADWTVKPARNSEPLIKYVSALAFVLLAGSHAVGIVA